MHRILFLAIHYFGVWEGVEVIDDILFPYQSFLKYTPPLILSWYLTTGPTKKQITSQVHVLTKQAGCEVVADPCRMVII